MKANSQLLIGNKIVYGRIIFFSGLNILTAFLLNILLPQYIGIVSYGEYRYLYSIIGFSGVLHLGYLDGYYLLTLEKFNNQKASVSYLIILVCLLLFLLLFFANLMGYELGRITFLIAFLLIVSNFINLANISLNLQEKYIGPIVIQITITIGFLLAILHPSIAKWIHLYIGHTILVLLIIQFIWLSLLNIKSKGNLFVKLGMEQWKFIFQFHRKGIKTLSIGLIIVLSIGLDKLALKNQLNKEYFGFYCFSNSILTSLLGISLSISNKFVSQLYQDKESLKAHYNKLIRTITCIGLCLIIASFEISKCNWIEIHGYNNLVKYLIASMGLFSYLCLIHLVHSNLAKVFQFEIPFFLIYLSAIGLCFGVYQIGFRNLNQMLWISSLIYYIAILLFEALFIKKYCQIHLSLSSKIFAASPLGLIYWLLSN